MKAVRKQLGIMLLLFSQAGAQDTSVTAIQDIFVSREDGNLRVEVVLSSPVLPSVTAEHHPERLVLHLPHTTDHTAGKRIDVNRNDSSSIHSVVAFEDGQSTNIVIELDQARPYALSADKNRIVLTFGPMAQARKGSSQGAPNAAALGVLEGIFHRTAKPKANDAASSADAITPAASGGVLNGGGPDRTKINDTASNTDQVAPAANGGLLNRPAIVQTSPSTQDSKAQDFPAAQPTTVTQSAVPQETSAEPSAAANQIEPTDQSNLPALNTATQEAGTETAPASSSTSKTPVLSLRAADPSLRTVFRVKYVAEGVAYLDGGRAAGLKEGVKLEVQETDLPTREGTAVIPSDPRVIAELEVTAVAETSAVTDIHAPKRPVKTGDLAYLSTSDAEALVQQTALSPTRKYPAVVSFTEGDTLDDEVRDEVPRPPQPSVNRARGRIGFDYMGTISHGTYGLTSSDFGMIFRGDITRINGTYWNLSGYWRGRFTSQSPAGQQTLQDLINRTYHLSMTYDNPNASWVAGFGRLYLPWASSLDTIDGGYVGKKLSQTATLGIFGGSTPDPTSYDYSPDRVIGGGFINFTGGDYAGVHYSSTAGAGVSMLSWQLDKPFGFLENIISYKQRMSIYDALQVDSPTGNPAVPAPGAGLSRNFLTFRVQPHPRLELDFNHTYFRDIPTFDPALIGTGLLDKYLFQGFSIGARIEVKKQIFVYTQLGRSSRTGDTKSSLNQLYGITFNRLPWWGLRADFHYAEFNSSFGSGSYKSFSVSRTFTDILRLEVLAGKQAFNSALTTNSNSWFVTSNVETNFGPHYFIQGGYTVNRGQLSYDQWMFTLGYRFDSKARHRE